MTNQAPITGLHNSTLLHNSTDYLMLAQSCKFGFVCCFIGLTHPAACTRVRVPLTFGGYKHGLQPESLADGNWLVKQKQPVSKIETKSDTNLRSLYES